MPKVHPWTKNTRLNEWIAEAVRLCNPDSVHLCDGSQEEYDQLCKLLVSKGTFIPLNERKRPHSYWCHSHPEDVARVEEATFICSKNREDAGPTNYWKDPVEMHSLLQHLFFQCMQGRTLYIIPYSLGPLGGNFSRIGVQITDSPYVVVNMHIMTRVGTKVLDVLGDGFFVSCMHSVGVPLKKGEQDSNWPCRPQERYIVHFPEERSIWSFGSGYGGNALLGKKSFALRIASVIARNESWMAEHMLLMGVTSPEGEKKYFAAAFPSACGKTNLAMLKSTLPGWRVECVGDDIAWMRFKSDGRLYAINPEAGMFGVAPGTSYESNPYAMESLNKNTIFTNTALTSDQDIWWEAMTKEPPASLIDWQGNPWTAASTTKAAHPNARFTAPLQQCPIIDPAWEDPEGVPISAILFGGRRSTVVPLVFEAFNWQHGTFLGASMRSEMTAAAKGQIGKLRHDPFAMLPFCGYNMGDYFAHWLSMGLLTEPHNLPKIFHVNWFRKSKEGSYLWPGFGENMRIIKWIFERTSGKEPAIKTPIGWIPRPDRLDVSGLSLPPQILNELFAVDIHAYLNEVEEIERYFFVFGNKLPEGIRDELISLKNRLIECALLSKESPKPK